MKNADSIWMLFFVPNSCVFVALPASFLSASVTVFRGVQHTVIYGTGREPPGQQFEVGTHTQNKYSMTRPATKATRPKRHHMTLRDYAKAFANVYVRRDARCVGVKRAESAVYDRAGNTRLRAFLEHVLRASTSHSVHARRRTVTAADVRQGLKDNGVPQESLPETSNGATAAGR